MGRWGCFVCMLIVTISCWLLDFVQSDEWGTGYISAGMEGGWNFYQYLTVLSYLVRLFPLFSSSIGFPPNVRVIGLLLVLNMRLTI